MRTMSGGPCLHYDCTNRNSFGYCKTTVCINQNYQHEQLISTTNRTEPVVVKPLTNADKYIRNATDEELADWIARQTTIGGRVELLRKYKFWLDWLKQEVRDDPNEART